MRRGRRRARAAALAGGRLHTGSARRAQRAPAGAVEGRGARVRPRPLDRRRRVLERPRRPRPRARGAAHGVRPPGLDLRQRGAAHRPARPRLGRAAGPVRPPRARVRPDGSVLVAGRGTDVQGNDQVVLARLNAGGRLDAGYGRGGVVRTQVSGAIKDRPARSVARAIAPTADGTVLVTGSTSLGGAFTLRTTSGLRAPGLRLRHPRQRRGLRRAVPASRRPDRRRRVRRPRPAGRPLRRRGPPAGRRTAAGPRDRRCLRDAAGARPAARVAHARRALSRPGARRRLRRGAGELLRGRRALRREPGGQARRRRGAADRDAVAARLRRLRPPGRLRRASAGCGRAARTGCGTTHARPAGRSAARALCARCARCRPGAALPQEGCA